MAPLELLLAMMLDSVHIHTYIRTCIQALVVKGTPIGTVGVTTCYDVRFRTYAYIHTYIHTYVHTYRLWS